MTTSDEAGFSLDVDLDAPPAAVYEAFVRASVRQRWLRLPGRTVASSETDWVVDAVEAVQAVLLVGEVEERLERTTHVLHLAPPSEVAFAYRAVVQPRPSWISLVVVEIHERAGGSRVTWTERCTVVRRAGDDEAHVPHLRLGTRLQLNGLATALGVTPRPATDR